MGIAHSENELPDKTYECSKIYAQGIAKECSCILVDKTSRGNESANAEQEEILKKSLLEKKAEIDRRLEKVPISSGDYSSRKRPASWCADPGD